MVSASAIVLAAVIVAVLVEIAAFYSIQEDQPAPGRSAHAK